MAADLLQVKVMTPREVLFQGKARAVSSKNIQGKFDLLSQHANFISLVGTEPITILKEDRSKQTFNFTQAIIYLVKDQVTVFGDPQAT